MWYCKYKEQHNIFVQIGHGQNNVHKCVSVHKWKSVNSVRLVLRSVIFNKNFLKGFENIRSLFADLILILDSHVHASIHVIICMRLFICPLVKFPIFMTFQTDCLFYEIRAAPILLST